MPWVHVKDVANLHEYVINHPEIHGVLNAVAPEMVTNYQFTKTLGKVLNVSSINFINILFWLFSCNFFNIIYF